MHDSIAHKQPSTRVESVAVVAALGVEAACVTYIDRCLWTLKSERSNERRACTWVARDMVSPFTHALPWVRLRGPELGTGQRDPTG